MADKNHHEALKKSEVIERIEAVKKRYANVDKKSRELANQLCDDLTTEVNNLSPYIVFD